MQYLTKVLLKFLNSKNKDYQTSEINTLYMQSKLFFVKKY